MWTDEKLISLLEEIRTLALSPYPFDDNDQTQRDPRLIMALGEIAGIATRFLPSRRSDG